MSVYTCPSCGRYRPNCVCDRDLGPATTHLMALDRQTCPAIQEDPAGAGEPHRCALPAGHTGSHDPYPHPYLPVDGCTRGHCAVCGKANHQRPVDAEGARPKPDPENPANAPLGP